MNKINTKTIKTNTSIVKQKENTHKNSSQIVIQAQKDSTPCLPIPKNTTPSKSVQNQLSRFIQDTYQPTLFLTVQLPDNHKTPHLSHANTHLKRIMAHVEWELLGRHWHKKHLPFICFAEKGISHQWHYHILFNQGAFSREDVETALNKTKNKLRLPSYVFKLEQVKDTGAGTYCIKEIKADKHQHFNGERIILSEVLFGLPISPVKKHINEPQDTGKPQNSRTPILHENTLYDYLKSIFVGSHNGEDTDGLSRISWIDRMKAKLFIVIVNLPNYFRCFM